MLLATPRLDRGLRVIGRVDRFGGCGQQRGFGALAGIGIPAQLGTQQAQLTVQLAPFAHAQEGQEIPATPVAQLALGQVLVGLAVGVPQTQDADELRTPVGKLGMGVVGGFAGLGRALAWVLDAQERGNGDHRRQAVVRVRGHQHPCQLHVHRQPRHLLADRGEPALLVHRAQLHQLLPAIGNGALVRCFQEREILDAAQPQLQHAQDHPGQRGTTDFRIGELGPGLEVGLGVQAHAHTLGDAAATALALVGAGLGDVLDVQAVQLLPWAVALDPRLARVDHITDARHGERGLGHVGGQHDAPPALGIEHPVLVGHRQPRIQRQHLGAPVLALFQQLMGIADLALTGQEHQDVAARLVAGDLIHRRHDAFAHGALTGVLALPFQRAVTHFHREGAPFDADHRRVVEVG